MQEKPKSGITKDEMVKWGGEEVFRQGLVLCNSGDVTEAVYDDDKVEIRGRIAQPNGWEMPLSFRLMPGGRIESHCPCATNQRYGQVCQHVLALGIAVWIKEMDEPEESEPSPAQGDVESAAGGGEDDDIVQVPMKPKFYALVSGNRAALSIELDAWYGDIDFPACSTQADRTVWIESPDDPYVRLVRSLKSEKEAVDAVRAWGFEPGYRENDTKLYTTDQHRILNFLGAGLPELRRRGWRIDLSKKLSAVTDGMRYIVPVVTVRDAPGGDFDVSYQFDAMGADVSPVEVQAALNRGDGFVMRDGEVFLLDNRAVEVMHDVFRDCATTQNGAPAGWFRVRGVHAPYVRAALGDLDCVELEDGGAASFRRTAEARSRNADAKFEPVSLGSLDRILRPYQKQGVYWMRFMEEAGLNGLLADEMGLGKTLQTLAWLSLPRCGSNGARRPALIICPTSLVRNWEAEAAKFTPWLRTLVVSGPGRAADFPRIPEADLVVTSYALLQRDFDEAYAGVRFSATVLDEAQHIKNRQTRNARTVKMIDTEARLVLTGTPVENSVADVWSIFDFLMPDYLGEYEGFRANYEDPIADGGQAAEVAQERLRHRLGPFIMRRVKKMVAKDLPDKIVKISYCPMDDDSQREYLEALQKTKRQAGDMIRARGFAKSKFELLAMLMKLRQIASRGKIDAFLEQLDDAIAGGHKVLVFSQFVKQLKTISEALADRGIRFCYLDGSTKDRLGECRRFNASPEIPVFLISLMAGGTGLNLTGADMVMHYDPWWNPAVEDQATDRAHRIGQKKNVYVMKMIASHTIEEKVLEMQRRKQAVINATVSTTDAAVMEKLTADDFASLLS